MSVHATDPTTGESAPASEEAQEHRASAWWSLEAVADRHLERLGGTREDNARSSPLYLRWTRSAASVRTDLYCSSG